MASAVLWWQRGWATSVHLAMGILFSGAAGALVAGLVGIYAQKAPVASLLAASLAVLVWVAGWRVGTRSARESWRISPRVDRIILLARGVR